MHAGSRHGLIHSHACPYAPQKVVAWTKKFGVEIGGFWISQDGAKTWIERTQNLTGAAAEAHDHLSHTHSHARTHTYAA